MNENLLDLEAIDPGLEEALSPSWRRLLALLREMEEGQDE